MIKVCLAEILAKKRLSIVELSDRTGISVAHLEILRDQGAMAVRLKTLDALCRALGCGPGDLLDYSEGE
jgi:putative transcriptional regulator